MKHPDDFKLCPVCCQVIHNPRMRYCSQECNAEASAYRTRIAHIRHVLAHLGFSVTLLNSVQLDITLPSDLQRYYPKYCHHFDFPFPGIALDALNEGSVLDELEAYLGTAVIAKLRSFSFKDVNRGDDFPTWFRRQITTEIFHDSAYTTFCPDCKKNYILSPQGWDTEMNCCTDCSIVAIPF